MITWSTCAGFLCWPMHWWPTLISENSFRHFYIAFDCHPEFHQVFSSGSISRHLLWASDEGSISIPVPVWVSVGSVGPSWSHPYWHKDDWQAEEEETLQVQGGLSWYVEVRFSCLINLFKIAFNFQTTFPFPWAGAMPQGEDVVHLPLPLPVEECHQDVDLTAPSLLKLWHLYPDANSKLSLHVCRSTFLPYRKFSNRRAIYWCHSVLTLLP